MGVFFLRVDVHAPENACRKILYTHVFVCDGGPSLLSTFGRLHVLPHRTKITAHGTNANIAQQHAFVVWDKMPCTKRDTAAFFKCHITKKKVT